MTSAQAPAGGASPPDDDDSFEPDDTLADEDPVGEDADPGPAVADATKGRRRLQRSGDYLAVHSGEALTLAEATAVLGEHSAQVVVVVGEVDAGKTTLLAAMYETVAAGPVQGWTFAGSLSLVGFESRSHLAMAASNRSEEDPPRTSRSTERVALHLTVRSDAGDERHLLWADVSGEHAETLLRHDDPGDYGPLLRSATRVVVLVDGERLVEPVTRNLALADARTLLRALAEGDDIREETAIDYVITKWDKCGHTDGVAADVVELADWAAGIRGGIAVHRTAARPHGEGLDELFTALLQPPAPRPARPTRPAATRRRLHRFAPNDGIVRTFIAAAARSRG